MEIPGVTSFAGFVGLSRPGFAAHLNIGTGTPRREASRPPLSPTELVFQAPELLP